MQLSEARRVFGIATHTYTEKEVKLKLKTLRLKHHPDKGGSKEAFDRVQKANEVLMRYLNRPPRPTYREFADVLKNPATKTYRAFFRAGDDIGKVATDLLGEFMKPKHKPKRDHVRLWVPFDKAYKGCEVPFTDKEGTQHLFVIPPQCQNKRVLVSDKGLAGKLIKSSTHTNIMMSGPNNTTVDVDYSILDALFNRSVSVPTPYEGTVHIPMGGKYKSHKHKLSGHGSTPGKGYMCVNFNLVMPAEGKHWGGSDA